MFRKKSENWIKLVLGLAACALPILSTQAFANAKKISGSRLWFSLPPYCEQNENDEWIQCRGNNDQPLAQFRFIIGEAKQDDEKLFYTQDGLKRVANENLRNSAPYRAFQNRVIALSEDAVEAERGKMSGSINYDHASNPQGIWCLSADWTYTNGNGVEIVAQVFEYWDNGQYIDLRTNFPISSSDAENRLNIEIVGSALRDMEIK